MVDYSLIGKTNFFCGVSLNWSFDSKYLIVSVLTPRVRVDNEYKVIIDLINQIMTYNGDDVIYEKFDTEVYEVSWINPLGI